MPGFQSSLPLTVALLFFSLSSLPIGGEPPPSPRARSAQTPDILIYGATPSGISAAVSAAKGDHTVLLIEPTDRIGGLVNSGLSDTDFRSFESLTGDNREDFVGVLPVFTSGSLTKVFAADRSGIFRAPMPRIPNNKST